MQMDNFCGAAGFRYGQCAGLPGSRGKIILCLPNENKPDPGITLIAGNSALQRDRLILTDFYNIQY